jgi:triacylglycerol lipase
VNRRAAVHAGDSRWERVRRLIGGLTVAVLASLAATGSAGAVNTGAALTEPPAALAAALECHGDLGGTAATPVILVHGAGSSPEESFSFGYVPALQRLGFPVCTVRLPGHGLVDMQCSIQYVVHAVREVAQRSGRRVSLVGHSIGAVLAVYAPSFWPDLAALIDDDIGLAGPYRGGTSFNPACTDNRCPIFSWQLRPASNLIRAFRDKPHPVGPSFTAVATAFDEVVTPAPEAGLLPGAANVVVQSICRLRPIEHFLMAADAVTYAVALDALTHPGPADPARVARTTCLQVFPPGSDLARGAARAPLAVANATVRSLRAPAVNGEPQLRRPFDPDACPRPASLSLTRRCASGGRLRIALTGDVDTVRRVDFKLGRRLVHRDDAAPFSATLATGTPRLARARRLRAIAILSSPPGERRILSRPLPRCRDASWREAAGRAIRSSAHREW